MVARHMRRVCQLAERDGFSRIPVDETQGVADPRVGGFIARVSQSDEPRQQLVDDAERFHALMNRAFAVQTYALNQRVAVVVNSRVGRMQPHGFVVFAYCAEKVQVVVGSVEFHGKIKVGEDARPIRILINMYIILLVR